MQQEDGTMNDLLGKISTYNLFNYLLPGILFVFIAKDFAGYDFIQENDIFGAVLYYFIGMVISRIGSLVVEPILHSMGIIKIAARNAYCIAAKKNERIELFLEINNTYRTIVAMFILLLLLKAYRHYQSFGTIPENETALAVAVLLLVIFIFAYRKQANYINDEISISSKGRSAKKQKRTALK
jgi:hypothetical protein